MALFDFNPSLGGAEAVLDARKAAVKGRDPAWNYKKYAYCTVKSTGNSQTITCPTKMTIGDGSAPTGGGTSMYTSADGPRRLKPILTSCKITNEGGQNYVDSYIYEVEFSYTVYTKADLEKAINSFMMVGGEVEISFGWRNGGDAGNTGKVIANVYNWSSDSWLFENTYINDRKIINVSSDDRDVKKYPKANHLEIALPEKLDYVTSIRLVNASIPINDYVFSERNQNTKLWLRVADTVEDLSTASFVECTIPSGSYEAHEHAIFILRTSLNAASGYNTTGDMLFDVNGGISYNPYTNKMTFRPNKALELGFEKPHNYELDCNDKNVNINAYEQDLYWGLGYYLGFDKKSYVISPGESYITPNQFINKKDHAIFVEVEHLNNMDEIVPYQSGNKCHGNVNSAFAKIPISTASFRTTLNADKNDMIHGVTAFNEPLRQLSKMKFKFRYHDGRLVDFGSAPVSLTVEVSRLGDKLLPNQLVRNLY